MEISRNATEGGRAGENDFVLYCLWPSESPGQAHTKMVHPLLSHKTPMGKHPWPSCGARYQVLKD